MNDVIPITRSEPVEFFRGRPEIGQGAVIVIIDHEIAASPVFEV